jgi:Na+/melibiose symporter-like transporter
MEERLLKKSTLWAYALGDNGFFISMTLYTTYPLIFMTKCLGLAFPLAVQILTLTKILDIIINFMSGAIIEKIRMPWGKYRSWFLAGPIIAGIATCLFFSPLLKTVPAPAVLPLGVFLMLLWNVASNIVIVCHNAMNSILAHSPLERVRIFKFSRQTQAFTDAIAGFFMMKIVFAVGREQTINLAGMQAIGIVYSLVYFILSFSFFLNLKDYKDSTGGYGQRIKPIDVLKTLFTNGKIAALTLSGIFTFSAETFFRAVASFFFLYVLFSPSILDAFNWTTVITAFIGATLAMPLAKRTSKKTTYITGYVIMTAALVLAYVSSGAPYMSLASICLGILGLNFARSVFVPMYSDVSDLAKYNTGRMVISHVMMAYNLNFKVAGLIAANASGLLAKAGYVTGVEPTAAVSQGIRMTATLGPAAFALFGALLMLVFYRFDERQMTTIQAELTRREAGGAGV